MARANRFAVPGHFHHVTAKFPGYFMAKEQVSNIQKSPLLCDDACQIFEQALRETKKKFSFGLFSCTLMSNHYHMLIGIPATAPEGQISKILHAFHNKFAHWYNRAQNRIGQVIVDRPRTPVIENIKH